MQFIPSSAIYGRKKERKGPKIAYFCMEYGLILRSRSIPVVWVFSQVTTSKRQVICR